MKVGGPEEGCSSAERRGRPGRYGWESEQRKSYCEGPVEGLRDRTDMEQKGHGGRPQREEMGDGPRGRPRPASHSLACPDARAWPRVTWPQPRGHAVKITSWSCHGYRTMTRYGGLPVTLSAVAGYGRGGSRRGRLGEHTLSLSHSSVAG